MEYGETMSFLMQAREEGFEVPELDDRPELSVPQRWYMDAFHRLSNSRQFGFSGPQPLQMSEMVSFMNARHVTDTERRKRLVEYVQELDAVYIESQYGDDE